MLGALKRGLSPIERELGIYVCGGRGKHSRQTPAELIQVGKKTGLDAAPLTLASRLVAKVDSAAVQDGFDIYLHSFVVTADGKWCVVQQGMSDARGEARRYHWLSEDLQSFLDSPHAAIEGKNQGTILNLADARAERNRRAELELLHAGPDPTIAILKKLRDMSDRGAHKAARAQRSLDGGNTALSLFPELDVEIQHQPLPAAPPLPHLHMPAHHDVRASDVVLRRLHGVLAAAADRGPKDFTELLLTPGVGARTVASLALVAEVVHGAPSRFSDPARFSIAHGGKDSHPFPVPLRVYDETIRVLKTAVNQAKLGNEDKLAAIQRLDTQARTLERVASGPTFDALLNKERSDSKSYGGRTVFD